MRRRTKALIIVAAAVVAIGIIGAATGHNKSGHHSAAAGNTNDSGPGPAPIPPSVNTPTTTTPPAPTTTTSPPPPTTTVPTTPPLTQQQESAVQAANQYLSYTAFSQQGLIDQLDSSAGSGYSVNDATVAVDSLTFTVDWNAEAVKAAKQYMQYSPFSCQGLIDQLDSSAGDKYTLAQATYGAHQAGDCG